MRDLFGDRLAAEHEGEHHHRHHEGAEPGQRRRQATGARVLLDGEEGEGDDGHAQLDEGVPDAGHEDVQRTARGAKPDDTYMA